MQTESGRHNSKGEVIDDPIRRAGRQEENVEVIRAGLKRAEAGIEQHGYSKKTVSAETAGPRISGIRAVTGPMPPRCTGELNPRYSQGVTSTP